MQITRRFLDDIFATPLGQQLDEVFITQDGTPFVTQQQAEVHAALLKDQTITHILKKDYHEKYA